MTNTGRNWFIPLKKSFKSQRVKSLKSQNYQDLKLEIDGNTKIYGIFGWPISHTASPAMHNAAFKYLGINSIYVPFYVTPENIKKAINSIIPMGISGVNVTVPYKEIAFKLVDEVSREARLIGAVNTIVVKGDTLIGHNTDAQGFLKSIRHDGRIDPYRKDVLLLGSGGAARAVAIQLALKDVKSMVIANRTLSRAKRLAFYIKRYFPKIEIAPISLKNEAVNNALERADILINTTSCGMKKADPLLVNQSLLRGDIVVYDLIYKPKETKLLKEARRRGSRAVNGFGMLLYQGAAAFEIWTGKKAPIEVMRKALEIHV